MLLLSIGIESKVSTEWRRQTGSLESAPGIIASFDRMLMSPSPKSNVLCAGTLRRSGSTMLRSSQKGGGDKDSASTARCAGRRATGPTRDAPARCIKMIQAMERAPNTLGFGGWTRAPSSAVSRCGVSAATDDKTLAYRPRRPGRHRSRADSRHLYVRRRII